MTVKYQRKADVGEQQVGDERMLLDESSNCVHVLNGSAAFIWDCLKKPVAVPDIERRLAEQYDLSAAKDVPGSIQRVLDDLEKKQLVTIIRVD